MGKYNGEEFYVCLPHVVSPKAVNGNRLHLMFWCLHKKLWVEFNLYSCRCNIITTLHEHHIKLYQSDNKWFVMRKINTWYKLLYISLTSKILFGTFSVRLISTKYMVEPFIILCILISVPDCLCNNRTLSRINIRKELQWKIIRSTLLKYS
jgi:hypothetical protein